MIAPIGDSIKFNSKKLMIDWLRHNSFELIGRGKNKVWVGESMTAQITILVRGRFSVQLGVPA